MNGSEEVRVRIHADLLQNLRSRLDLRAVLFQRVVHDVAGEVRAGGEAFAGQVRHRRLGRAEEQVGAMVGEDAVRLLRHRPVEAAQARLDVRKADAHLRGRERACKRRVCVAEDDDPVRSFGLEDGLDAFEDLGCLPRVRAGANAELVVGGWQVQLLEEDVGQHAIVVLAGVDQHLLVLLTQGLAERGGLDELGPGADDRHDLHGRVGLVV